DIKWTTSPKVFVEIALLNIANRYRESESIDNDAIAELQQKVAQMEKQLVTLQKRPELEQRSSSKETRRAQPRTKKTHYKIPYEKIHHVLSEAKRSNLKEVQSQWASFLSKHQTKCDPSHASIHDSNPAAASEPAHNVSFKYEIYFSLFLDNQDLIKSVLSQKLGKQLDIIPIPSQDWK